MPGPAMMLPVELMALCFSQLGFLDRQRVALVSRYWRACSIGHPRLWRHVDLVLVRDHAHKADVLRQALVRSRDHTLDLFCDKLSDECQREVAAVIRDSMHRFRAITWAGDVGHEMWTVPAPALEYLRFNSRAPVRVSADFLASVPGKLSTLLARYFLPSDRCPGLQGVVELALSARQWVQLHQSILALFPRLAKLYLREFPNDAGRLQMPPWPAGSSRLTVTLSTARTGCNLFKHAHATPARHIRLDMPLENMALGLERALVEAVELTVEHVSRSRTSSRVARVRLASGSRLDVYFRHHRAAAGPDPFLDAFINGLLATRHLSLPLLHSIAMPDRALSAVLIRRPLWHALRSIRVLVYPGRDGWTELACMSSIRLHPHLSLVTIDAQHTLHAHTVPEAAIFEFVRRYEGRGEPGTQYVLRGFPDECHRPLNVPQ